MKLVIFFLLALVCAASASQWAIKLQKNVSPTLFALKHDLKHVEKAGEYHIFKAGTKLSKLAFRDFRDVIKVFKQVKLTRFRRK